MSAGAEIIAGLVTGGMSAADAALLLARAAVEMAAAIPSKGALRTRKWRAQQASQTVTGDAPVTANESVTERHKASQSVTCDNVSLSKEVSKEKGKRESTRASQLPSDWRPGDDQWTYACGAIGPPGAEAELVKFRNHALDKGRTSKNWNAAFRNWIDRALEYRHQRPQGNGNGKPTIHDANKEFTRQLAELDEPAPSGDLREQAGGSVVRLLPAR